MQITMIRFRLDELLEARAWSNYRLARESGIHANVVGKYRRNLVKQPDLGVMNQMCETLGCDIGDLLEYVPDKPARVSRIRKVSKATRKKR